MKVYIEGHDSAGNPLEVTRELDPAVDNTNPTKLGYIVRAICTKNDMDPASISYIEVTRTPKRPAGSPPL